METPTNTQAPLSSIPLLDLDRENGPLREEIAAAMTEVAESGRFILGPWCTDLEQAIAKRTGTSFGIGCASGSDALLLCLMGLDIGPGDEVLLPSFTFFATASAVRRLGATPVFVDILPDSFNIDPEDLEQKITPRTRAIIPVHLFGRCANMTHLMQVADKHQLPVVEDCAQSIDATHGDRASGNFGLAGCFSFYPTKNLGGIGDGGMITTSDPEFAERLGVLRAHGMKPRYHHSLLGINSRLDSLQAAVLLVKLPHLASWTQQRQRNAARYLELFAEHASTAAGLELLKLPSEEFAGNCVWNQFTVRVGAGRRDALRQSLAAQNIGSEIYYPLPLHLQPCFADLGWEAGSLPVTEQAAAEVLSLPIFPTLTPAEQHAVVNTIAKSLTTPGQRKIA